MIKFILTTTLFEFIRKFFVKGYKNNPENIAQMKNMPIFTDVGKLREILSNFSDDTPTQLDFYEVHHIQIRVVNGKRHICFGTTDYLSEPYDGIERKFVSK